MDRFQRFPVGSGTGLPVRFHRFHPYRDGTETGTAFPAGARRRGSGTGQSKHFQKVRFGSYRVPESNCLESRRMFERGARR
jgi:hypothetical protein